MIWKRSRFRFELTQAKGAQVLRLLDSHYHADSLGPLEAKFMEIEAAAPGSPVVIDLSGVSLLSSTALRAIRAAHRRLEATGARIVAAGAADLVADVLKFAPFIDHHPTVDEALAALNAKADAGEPTRGSK